MKPSIFENEIKIQKRIAAAFEEDGEGKAVAFDIGFHMTDWLSDIQKLEYVYSNIERLSSDEITGFVRRFVSHVPNHLNAAMKLSGMGSVTDVFEVGIFEDDD
jgi:hypothetical protein